MSKAIVKLAYRQVINAACKSDFEKNVLFASYQEFLIKSQAYNPGNRLKTFDEMKNNDGRAATLHFKLSFSVGYFIETLKNRVPDLFDNAGNNILFEAPRFELIASDITNADAHQVAINYVLPELTLLTIFGEHMVLTANNGEDTFTLKMQDNLSIISYKEFSPAALALNGFNTSNKPEKFIQ